MIFGEVEGHQGQGRPLVRWTGTIAAMMGLDLLAIVRVRQDQTMFHSAVRGVAMSRSQLGSSSAAS